MAETQDRKTIPSESDSRLSSCNLFPLRAHDSLRHRAALSSDLLCSRAAPVLSPRMGCRISFLSKLYQATRQFFNA